MESPSFENDSIPANSNQKIQATQHNNNNNNNKKEDSLHNHKYLRREYPCHSSTRTCRWDLPTPLGSWAEGQTVTGH